MPAISKDKKQHLIARVRSVIAQDHQITLDDLAQRLDSEYGTHRAAGRPAKKRKFTMSAEGRARIAKRLGLVEVPIPPCRLCHDSSVGPSPARQRIVVAAGGFTRQSRYEWLV